MHHPVVFSFLLIICPIVVGEASLGSAKFALKMKTRYNIPVFQEKSRNKAYMAESAIGHIKKRLYKEMDLKKKDKAPQPKNWIDVLPRVVKQWNSEFVPNTRIRRSDMTEKKYYKVLSEKMGVSDIEDLFNSASMPETQIPSDLRDKIFRFEVGQCVLLASYVDPDLTSKERANLKGARDFRFSPKKRYVAERKLRSTHTLSYVPVYRLKGLPRYYYASELVPFSPSQAIRERRSSPSSSSSSQHHENRDSGSGSEA